MDPIAAHLFLCAVLLFSAATQVLTGFGFGLVALAILGMSMDLREAVLLITPAGLALNIALFLKLRKEFSFEGIVPLLLACLAGVPAGVWLLLSLGSRGLSVLMGASMVATVLHRIWMVRRKQESVWDPVKAGIPCGFLSGVLGGALGAGGPPVVSYLVNRRVNRFRYVATVQVAAAIASVIRLVQFAEAGRYGEVEGWMFATSLAAVLCGVFIGAILLRKVSDETSRKAVLAFLLLGGVYYLVQA